MKLIKTTALFLAVLMLTFAAASCASVEEKIVGTWKTQKTVLGVVTESTYTFTAEGTGTGSTLLGVNMDFTYTISEDTLTITTNLAGITTTTTAYTFELSGDTLTLTDGGETLTYTRQ